MVRREFSVGVVGGGESGHLQGREGGVEQRRVKCCRTEDFETIDSKSSNKENLASWVRRSARACVRWPRSHVSELREAKPFPSLLKLDSHKIDNNF